ncbi:MAG: amino acid permease [Thermoanaerobaculia bacterium]|nr:amino acid permease [Thermoanaerobaculia bacterium]
MEKTLGVWQAYAVSMGAMLSSGFFLLPGLTAAKTGPSVILAYFTAGLLMVPAMLCKAELSTAMPRAGGTYYFMDRSMRPLMGSVGGLGTWLVMSLKSAFALIGMGAYLGLAGAGGR